MSEMISIKEAAERWKLTVRRVSTLCKEGKVEGAIKQKNRWIFQTASRPATCAHSVSAPP